MVLMPPQRRHVVLLCGPAASLAFLCADVVGGTLASPVGYSFAHNSISELLVPATSTPLGRRVCLAFMILSDVLGIAFGFLGLARRRSPAVWGGGGDSGGNNAARSAGGKDRGRGGGGPSPPLLPPSGGTALQRIAGDLLGIAAACNLASSAVFPQDERGADPTPAGVAHLVLVGIAAALTLGAMVSFVRHMGDGMPLSRFLGKISFAAFGTMAACTAATPYLEPNGLLGIGERCSVYTFLAWQAAVGVTLFGYASS